MFVAIWASWHGEGKGLSYRGSMFSMQVFLIVGVIGLIVCIYVYIGPGAQSKDIK